MRIFTIVLATIVLFGLSGAAMAGGGASIFKNKCSVCHGQNAQGNPGMAPKLAGTDFIKGPAGPIKQTIVNGRSGGDKKYKNIPLAMPKLGVSDADAEAIVKYLKSL